MKLSVFINQAFYSQDGIVSTDLSFVRYIESFSEVFDTIEILAPVADKSKNQGHYICSKNLQLTPLPYYENVGNLAKRSIQIIGPTVRTLNNALTDCDLLWIVGPHPLGWAAANAAKKQHCDAFYHIRGNILNDIKVRFTGMKYYLAYGYAGYMHLVSIYLCHRIPTLTVGKELLELYRHGAFHIDTMSPSLISSRVIEETRSLLHGGANELSLPIQLLFVGRPEPEKGLTYLFEALNTFNNEQGLNIRLAIVGEAQRGSKQKEHNLKKLAHANKIDHLIDWKGYVSYGDELLQIYRQSDIFILPSLAEGIPKVLYEAMATGLPIVSTNVGGIPAIVEHEVDGLLIDAASSAALCNAIMRLSNDHELRQRLISHALSKAEGFTMERSRDEVINKVRQAGLLQSLQDKT